MLLKMMMGGQLWDFLELLRLMLLMRMIGTALTQSYLVNFQIKQMFYEYHFAANKAK
jgi:hypothetical protein